MGAFPGILPGLNVQLDGNFISFNLGRCLTVDGKTYKVGAVIVKGANNANVYFYKNGMLADYGLAAPGAENMVSNITFCFIECEQADLVIAFKAQVVGGWVSTVMFGNIYVGYYNFEPYPVVNKVYYLADTTQPVGNIFIADSDNDGMWEVTIDNSDQPGMLFKYESYLFVGTVEEYNACRTFYDFPYYQNNSESSSSLTFELPF